MGKRREQARLFREVMGQGLTPVGIGIAIGLAGALGLTQFLRSLLFGVQPADVLTLVIGEGTHAAATAHH